ncbi:MAG: hypothetical protein MUC50_09535 [Myxococcota bacterium]|nr:hypothetical protein [Myxococcota bacterium]
MSKVFSTIIFVAAVLAFLVGCAGGGGSTEPITVVRAADGNVSFASTINPILQDHCIRCHSAEKASGGFSIASYDTIMKGGSMGPLIIPGNPDGSLIIGSVTKTKTPNMPPKVFPALTDDRIQALREWITQGATNN